MREHVTTQDLVRKLTAMERHELTALARRPGPRPVADMAKLTAMGLVEFTRETKSGTTWHRATRRGKEVFRYLVGCTHGNVRLNVRLTEDVGVLRSIHCGDCGAAMSRRRVGSTYRYLEVRP